MKRILTFGTIFTMLAFSTCVLAANFTPGNIVVYRMGDGATVNILTNTGSAVFLDEYTTSGTFVQSVAIRTNYFGANAPLVGSGVASTEGGISLSTDGRFIVLTGFAGTLNQSNNGNLATTSATAVPRVIGLVDQFGNVDTTTAQTNSLVSTEDIRSGASTDGTNLWYSGDTSGLRYALRGSGVATQLSTFVTNLRHIHVFSNELYFTDASGGSIRIGTLTNGVSSPATSAGFMAALTGTPTSVGSPYGFVLLNLPGGPGPLNTLYYADDTPGAIYKYSLVSGAWVSNGFITASNVRGLAGTNSGSTVKIYMTVANAAAPPAEFLGGGNLLGYTDSAGYNAAPSNNGSDIGDIADFNVTVATRKVFRGVALVPSGGETFPVGSGRLSVGPILGYFASGLTGCSIAETDKYSLANFGTNSINWTASCDSNWVSLSPSSGTIASGGSITVTAFFNANVTSLVAGTNTATITFTNTTASPDNLGTTTRPVQLVLSDQTITPSTDFFPSGDVGQYVPSNKLYTVSSGSAITLAVSKTASWINLSATSVGIGACASTVITVSVNVANANALTNGFYSDTIVFSNATAGGVIDTRNVSLQKGFVFWSDDFSTFSDGDLSGQLGWQQNNAGAGGPNITVSGGAVVLPPDLAVTGQWLFKNFPLTGGCGSNALPNIPVFAGLQVKVTKVSATNAVYFATFFNFNNGTLGGGASGCTTGAPNGFTIFELAAQSLDLGFTNFVLAARTSQQGGNPYFRSTQSWPTGTTLRVVIMTDTHYTNTYVYANPTSAVLTDQVLSVLASNIGGFTVDADVGGFSFRNFGGATPTSGELIYKASVSTNYADVYNFITGAAPPSDPFTNFQTHYGLSGGNAAGTADPDGDGMINTNEFLAGFNPTNSASALRVTSITRSGTDVNVTYLGASGDNTYTGGPTSRTNVLDVSTGTANGSYSNNFVSTGLTNVLSGGTGSGTVASFIHTNGASTATKYYRVRVLLP